MVESALMDIFDSLGNVRGGDAAQAEFVKVLRALANEGLDVDDGMLYDEPTPRPRKPSVLHIPQALAAAGLAPAGKVSFAKSLWRRCVPRRLRAIYRAVVPRAQPGLRRHKWGSPQLLCMFQSIHMVAKGVKPTSAPPMASAFLRPKSSSKCRCLLNATTINALDPRPQPKARLPALTQIRDIFATKVPGKLWMCKLDLSNASWSIRLPRSWRRTFVMRAGRQRWRIPTLPFGWKYSPVICQRLVQGIVSSALRGYSATWHVYLDDVLITARSQRVAAKAIQAAAQALRAAGYIISPKSEMEPTTDITFIGKRPNSITRSISNTMEMMTAATRLWVHALGR